MKLGVLDPNWKMEIDFKKEVPKITKQFISERRAYGIKTVISQLIRLSQSQIQIVENQPQMILLTKGRSRTSKKDELSLQKIIKRLDTQQVKSSQLAMQLICKSQKSDKHQCPICHKAMDEDESLLSHDKNESS